MFVRRGGGRDAETVAAASGICTGRTQVSKQGEKSPRLPCGTQYREDLRTPLFTWWSSLSLRRSLLIPPPPKKKICTEMSTLLPVKHHLRELLTDLLFWSEKQSHCSCDLMEVRCPLHSARRTGAQLSLDTRRPEEPEVRVTRTVCVPVQVNAR